MKVFLRKISAIRILTIAALTGVGIVSILLICVALLPTIVSSDAVQARIKKALSFSMKRQVVWSKLAMTWSDGLTLSGLRFSDGPAPLLNADIDQLRIAPSVSRGADGRFGIDLAVRIRNVRAELAPGPSKPPPPPAKDPLTLLAESIQRIQGLDFPLPVDVRVMVEVAPLYVAYRTPVPGKQLKLKDFSFRFAMPSLAAAPVTAEIGGRVSFDNREIGKIHFNARVSDLVTKARRIHLASALFAVDGSAPGTSLAVTGGLTQADGFSARIKLDLPGLLAVAQPFIHPAVPALAGNIDLQLRAQSDARQDLHAMLTLDGSRLSANGGSLKAMRVGPLDVRILQQIVTNHTQQRVDFSRGSLSIPGLITAGWNASVNHPTVPERSLDITFGPLQLDLARLFSLAAPFLPPDAPVKELAGEATLRTLTVKLNGPDNNGTVALSGFGITLPRLRLSHTKGNLAAADISLLLEKAESPLSAHLPTKLTAELLWGIRKATLSGARPFSLQGAHGSVGVAITDLNLKSASPRKVAASVQMTQNMDFDYAALGSQLVIEKAHEQLRVLVRATERGDIEAGLPELMLNIAAVQASQTGKKTTPVPVSVSFAAEGLRLPAHTKVQPTLQHAVAKISAGDFIQLAAEAALSGGSPRRATTSGTARLDLHRAMPFAAAFVPTGLKADGVAGVVWNVAAPLPENAAHTEKQPLRSARAVLKQFDTLDVGLKLDTISATIPSAHGALRVTGLNTGPDVHLVYNQKKDSARFEGGVLFSGVSGLPGAAGKLPRQHGSFTFNGELSGWREFRLSEEFRIDPLAVSHEAELNVSRIDTLLDENQPFSTATLIKRLDATLCATFDGAFSRELKQLLPGFDVAGDISSGVRVDLSAGRELALRCSLKTKDFDLQLANGTKVEGLRTNLAFNRVYALAASQGERWTPLSAALIRPAVVITANPGAAEIVGRINDDLRGDVRGARSFSIRRLTTAVSGVPLVITALEGDLLFGQEKTGLSFFQADVLGGTLLARGVFDLRPEVPAIGAAGSFSHIDITRLLPKETIKRGGDQDAEITGEMSLTAPLTADQRELFEQLRLVLNVRKIGANAIERALFSLDPYERNEQLVAQRKTLRLGNLKGLRATAVDGAFSMEGEAQIKGVAVNLPKVERARISELPLRQELVKNRGGIAALRGVLDLVRADTLVVGPKGELSLKRRMYAQ